MIACYILYSIPSENIAQCYVYTGNIGSYVHIVNHIVHQNIMLCMYNIRHCILTLQKHLVVHDHIIHSIILSKHYGV